MSQEQTIRLAATPLEAILAGLAPADFELTRFFKQRGSGPRERAEVGDLVFTVLRHRRRLAHRLWQLAPMQQDSPWGLLWAAWADMAGWDDARLCACLGVPCQPEHPPEDPPSPAVTVSLPDWLWQALESQWGQATAWQLAHALNQTAPTDLRVNRLRTTREKAEAALASEGVVTERLPYAPDGLRLTGNHPVTTMALFRAGLFEIQDAGSQLIPMLLALRPGETVIDLCAGSGGKSLQMAALMSNRGRILATDTDAQRLSRLPPRMRRAGVSIIQTQALRHEGDPVLRRMTGKADAVLVDAPCSGTGTLRRRPEVKWRLTPDQVEAFHQRQCALLSAAARLLRPGGRLVYATCSLLGRENEGVAGIFLRENPDFRLVPAVQTLARQGIIGLNSEHSFLTLLPHAAGCDGFFAALFAKCH